MFNINFKEDNNHQYCTDNDAFGNILMLVGCPLIPQHHPSLIDREPYYFIKYFFMSLFVTSKKQEVVILRYFGGGYLAAV